MIGRGLDFARGRQQQQRSYTSPVPWRWVSPFDKILPEGPCEWTCYIGTFTCGLTDGPGFVADFVCSMTAYKICVATLCDIDDCEDINEDLIDFLNDSPLF